MSKKKVPTRVLFVAQDRKKGSARVTLEGSKLCGTVDVQGGRFVVDIDLPRFYKSTIARAAIGAIVQVLTMSLPAAPAEAAKRRPKGKKR